MSDDYTDEEAAALYDVLNPWLAGDEFYRVIATAASDVLDVGCGTGAFLKRLHADGHDGRLVGIDPDSAALAIARRQAGIEWRDGTAASLAGDAEFDLAVMMSHAFQCLVTDDELTASLEAIRRILRPGGTFAFETRNPGAKAWEAWAAAAPERVQDPGGRVVEITYEIDRLAGDAVSFSEITSGEQGAPLRRDSTTLRFLDEETLDGFLTASGFEVVARYGDWARGPVTPSSRELVTLARRPA